MLANAVKKIDAVVPVAWRAPAYTLLFNSQIKLASTAGIRVTELTPAR
jgi:hypothetical protein